MNISRYTIQSSYSLAKAYNMLGIFSAILDYIEKTENRVIQGFRP